MKIIQLLCYSFAAVLTLIGVHQSMLVGVVNSYFLFTFSLAFLFFGQYFRKKNEINEQNTPKIIPKPTKKSKK